MATVRIRHTFHPAALQRTLGARTGGAARDMERRGRKIQARARQLVGVKTGRLRSRILLRLVPAKGGGWGAQVYVEGVAYARFHHDGNYHTQGVFIRPVRARALRFTIGGRVIYAAKVRSFRGTHFLARAVPAGRR